MRRADAQILESIEWARWQLQFFQRHYVHNPEGHQENGYPERKHPPLAGRCKGYIVITQVVHVVPGGRRRRRAEGGGESERLVEWNTNRPCLKCLSLFRKEQGETLLTYA